MSTQRDHWAMTCYPRISHSSRQLCAALKMQLQCHRCSEAQLSSQAACAAPCWFTPKSQSQPSCMQGSATCSMEHKLSTKCSAELLCHTITGTQMDTEKASRAAPWHLSQLSYAGKSSCLTSRSYPDLPLYSLRKEPSLALCLKSISLDSTCVPKM